MFHFIIFDAKCVFINFFAGLLIYILSVCRCNHIQVIVFRSDDFYAGNMHTLNIECCQCSDFPGIVFHRRYVFNLELLNFWNLPCNICVWLVIPKCIKDCFADNFCIFRVIRESKRNAISLIVDIRGIYNRFFSFLRLIYCYIANRNTIINGKIGPAEYFFRGIFISFRVRSRMYFELHTLFPFWKLGSSVLRFIIYCLTAFSHFTQTPLIFHILYDIAFFFVCF